MGQIAHALASVGGDVTNAATGNKEVSPKWIRHAADATGYVTRLPFVQTCSKLRIGSLDAGFLLHRGWFHLGLATEARAVLSTG